MLGDTFPGRPHGCAKLLHPSSFLCRSINTQSQQWTPSSSCFEPTPCEKLEGSMPV